MSADNDKVLSSQEPAALSVTGSSPPRIIKLEEPPEPVYQKIGFCYSRYSTRNQKEMSIEAQQAVCEDLAAAIGVAIPPENRYFDKAKGGKSDDIRPEWNKLLALIRRGAVHYLFADEQSRLFRGEREVVDFKELINKHNMTVIARDIDSRVPGWEFMFSIRGAVNQLELITIRGRIKRSLAECVRRGHAHAHPGYGYKLAPILTPTGQRDHSEMVIEETEAAIVRRIFSERRAGTPIGKIGERLNTDGVPAPGFKRELDLRVATHGCAPTWTRGTLSNMLRRAIFKGVYKRGNTAVFMPSLAIVSEADWQAVQGTKRGPRLRGGGKEWAVGLCYCTCGAVLGVNQRIARHVGAYLFCSTCRSKSYLSQVKRMVSSTGENYLRAAIEIGIRAFLTPARVEEYRRQIDSINGQSDELKIIAARKKIAESSAVIQRLTQTLARIGTDGLAEIEDALIGAREDRRKWKLDLERMEVGREGAKKDVVKKQLMTDPHEVIQRLFDDSLPVYEVRVMLARIFPMIVCEASGRRGFSVKSRPTEGPLHVFLLTLNIGELLAAFTETAAIELEDVKIRIAVTQEFRQPIYTAQVLEAPVTNAPEQPMNPSIHPGMRARAIKKLARRTDLDYQRELAEKESHKEKTQLRKQFSKAERRRRREARLAKKIAG